MAGGSSSKPSAKSTNREVVAYSLLMGAWGIALAVVEFSERSYLARRRAALEELHKPDPEDVLKHMSESVTVLEDFPPAALLPEPPKKPFGLHNLPHDTLELIFQYAGIKAIYATEILSRDLRAAALSPSIWRDLYGQRWPKREMFGSTSFTPRQQYTLSLAFHCLVCEERIDAFSDILFHKEHPWPWPVANERMTCVDCLSDIEKKNEREKTNVLILECAKTRVLERAAAAVLRREAKKRVTILRKSMAARCKERKVGELVSIGRRSRNVMLGLPETENSSLPSTKNYNEASLQDKITK